MSTEQIKFMKRAIFVSLSCNVVLVLIKTAALMLVNSLAIAIDLGISFVGLAVSIILYYSVKLANKPADFVHNYGYGKVEHVCEAMEGVVLIGIAIAMSVQAFTSFFHPAVVRMPWIGFGSSLINVTLNFGGAAYILKMARKSGSPAVYTEGVHYRMEGFISGSIAISFLISMFLSSKGYTELAHHIDPITALCVSLFLIVPSFNIAKSAFFKLLDASVEEDSQLEMLKVLNRHIDEYCEFGDIKTRTAGRKKFVDCKITVPEDISFKKGNEIVSKLEDEIKESIPDSEVSVRMRPCKKDCTFIKDGKKCPYLHK
jgi:cation diffusion facilitator family transporter